MSKDNVIKLKGSEYDLEDTKFWIDIEKCIMHGILASDKHGHSSEIRFRVQPAHKDRIDGYKEKMPKGLYKSSAAWYRACFIAGERLIAEYMQRELNIESKGYIRWLKISCSLSAKRNIDLAMVEARKKIIEIEKNDNHSERNDLRVYEAALEVLKNYKACGLEVDDLRQNDDSDY